jgi:hypothetical protein
MRRSSAPRNSAATARWRCPPGNQEPRPDPIALASIRRAASNWDLRA